MTVRVAILTVSDTASRDASLDASGPALEQQLQAYASSQGTVYEVVKRAIVSDKAEEILQTVRGWCEDTVLDLGLVLTTGGTGFGVRDTTPEVRTCACETSCEPAHL